MFRRTMRLMTGGVLVAFALCVVGCGGEGKQVEPKVESKNAPLEPKSPGGPPGKGGEPSGPKGSSE